MKRFLLIPIMVITLVIGMTSPTLAAFYQGTPSPSLDPLFGTLVNFDDKTAGNPVLSGDYLSVGVESIVETEGLGTLAYYSGSPHSAPNYIATGIDAERGTDSDMGWDGTIEITLVEPTCKVGIGIAGISTTTKTVRIFDTSNVLLEEQTVPTGGNVYVYFERTNYDIKKLVITGDYFAVDDLQFIGPDATATALAIDIKPNSDSNSINAGKQGLLPVAILGSADFDVTNVNPATIELGEASIAMRGPNKSPKPAYSLEDVNTDGYMDMMVFFSVPMLALTGTETELTLSAELFDGTHIEGTDSIRIVPQ